MRIMLIPILLAGISVLAMDQDSDEIIQCSDEGSSEALSGYHSDADDDSSPSPQAIKRSRTKRIPAIPDDLNKGHAEITFKEAFDVLYDNQKMTRWNHCQVASWLWGLAFGSCIVFGVPGWTVAGLYCRNYGPINSCITTCQNTYDEARGQYTQYNQCANRCYAQEKQTLYDPYCQTGLALSFMPVLFFCTAICSAPITHAQHSFAHRYNQVLEKRLRWQLLTAHSSLSRTQVIKDSNEHPVIPDGHEASPWAQILTMSLNNQDIVIDENNIVTILGAAKHYKITALLNRCDTYIVEHVSPEYLLQLPESSAYPTSKRHKNLAHMLNVARDFDLPMTRLSLASDIVQELNTLTLKTPDALNKLRLLEDQEIDDIAHIFKKDIFVQKLSNHEFLYWIWPHAKDIALLRELIVDFCKDPQHKSVVDQAWDQLPEDLEEATATREPT